MNTFPLQTQHVCARKDCTERAHMVPKLCVPVQSPIAIENPRPMTAILGLAVCPRHYNEMTAQGLLDDMLRRTFTQVCAGRAEALFDQAYLVAVMLDSKEYQEWLLEVQPRRSKWLS